MLRPESALAIDAFKQDDDASVDSNNSEGGDDREELCELYREAKEIEDTARGDITGMRLWRMIVLLVIMVTYAGATAWTFVYLHSEQADDTGERYYVVTGSVRTAWNRQFAAFNHALASLSDTITAAARLNDTLDFPYVTVRNFEVDAGYTRASSKAVMVAWHPFVSNRVQWKAHVLREGDGWYTQGQALYRALSELEEYSADEWSHLESSDSPNQVLRSDIWSLNNSATTTETTAAPLWYCTPPQVAPAFVSFDSLSEDFAIELMAAMIETGDGVMSPVNPASLQIQSLIEGVGDPTELQQAYVEESAAAAEAAGIQGPPPSSSYWHPHSVHFQPVFATLHDRSSPIVGFVSSIVAWDAFLIDLIPDEEIENIIAVLKNSCGQSYTYRTLQDREVQYIGEGDWHDTSFDESEEVFPLITYQLNGTADALGHCQYSFHFYMSKNFTKEETTNLALMCSLALVVVFAVMVAVFFFFDRFVRRRNVEAINEAARSNAIVSSLFPTQVKARLFSETDKKGKNKKQMQSVQSTRSLSDDDPIDFLYDSKPIADLFPDTTILFADIVGFTAWSSVRAPTQVFILLETLYRAFDAIAKKRRIFKVETIGDCYVAVAGLPQPRKDHATAMARFANDCLLRMRVLTGKLEVVLGPDTGDLAMRMGLHSGPVTAGVLRGERGRFQLFGDTMNTAARMESNGERDKIQVSQETADLLVAAGKSNWLTKRTDRINAKGKGELQTYWLDVSSKSSETLSAVGTELTTSTLNSEADGCDDVHDVKTRRLIDWNVEVLLKLLRQIEAQRATSKATTHEPPVATTRHEITTLAEVQEVIAFPPVSLNTAVVDEAKVQLDPVVVQQLQIYVSSIAQHYTAENPFHNFEHASHVSMSVVKLLSRITVPDETTEACAIATDPLTQFSCVLAALIHDVDHPGVPNAQLVQENTATAQKYHNQSIAELNSIDIAWNLLMDDHFVQLRRAIYQTDDELQRFRQLVVNSVLATDIMDQELKLLRNTRWDRVFATGPNSTRHATEASHRKATTVIEHLIQASDVAHTMQHWHIYRKWNECFFMECYLAYRAGRSPTNPADGWYQGELGFFDCYILPLAQKLKDCGVFGVSSDEYLNYAVCNRQEWEKRGHALVAEMVAKVREQLDEDSTEYTA